MLHYFTQTKWPSSFDSENPVGRFSSGSRSIFHFVLSPRWADYTRLSYLGRNSFQLYLIQFLNINWVNNSLFEFILWIIPNHCFLNSYNLIIFVKLSLTLTLEVGYYNYPIAPYQCKTSTSRWANLHCSILVLMSSKIWKT